MSSRQSSRPPRVDAPAAGETTNPGQAGSRTPERVPPARPETYLEREWRLAMPPGQELLNANDRLHWAKWNRITQQLRSDAHLMARYLKIPRLARARIDAIYEPPDSRRRDAGNWYPTYKAQIDGLVDAGVLADDDHTRVDGPHMSIGDRFPKGRIVLSVGFYPHASAEHGHGEGVGHDSVEKVALDELHKRKIDLADDVLVVSDASGYFGESTRSEIEYARAHGKPVRFLVEMADEANAS